MKLKKKFIETINIITNELILLLKDKEDDYGIFARHIHVFIHERIDSILILIAYKRYWDTDILLRPIAEASVKLVYVSLYNKNGSKTNHKIEEFWKDLREINKLKQSNQAKEIAKKITTISKSISKIILSDEEEKLLRKKWSKKERQKIEQPWSYNEMIKTIAKKTNNEIILCLNRNFTQSSHLIHADETALSVIADRKGKKEDEKILQYLRHEYRLYSDMLTLYYWIYITTMKMYNKEINLKILKLKDEFYKIGENYKNNPQHFV